MTGLATPTAPAVAGQWETVEITVRGASAADPFAVDVRATLVHPERTFAMNGFPDGDGVYRIRVAVPEVGGWSFRIASSDPTIDGVTGAFEIVQGERRGPVRVDGLHFRYDDGVRHRPLGTTAYAWIHQPAELRERTLATLAQSPFTKLRMTVFPKSYLYNAEDPALFPFERRQDGTWDLERLDLAFFRALDERIAELGDLGIEADVILFHPYDRWGFAQLPPEAEDRYVRHLVRRLAAFPHVWWSLANEYDLMTDKTEADWERIARVVGEEDPVGHLTSIHNCGPFYDHARPWVTHVSAQRIDAYRTTENVDEWRRSWGKPVVVDEAGYEGDIDQGWGNIIASELVRRAWEGAVRGGYVGHGETYLNPEETLWWSKGGELVGESPARLAFLDALVADAPGGAIDPLASDWDLPGGGVEGEYVLLYFGFSRPSFRDLTLPDGRWHIDVIDTWEMTLERFSRPDAAEEPWEGTVRVPLPRRQFLAIRLVRAH